MELNVGFDTSFQVSYRAEPLREVSQVGLDRRIVGHPPGDVRQNAGLDDHATINEFLRRATRYENKRLSDKPARIKLRRRAAGGNRGVTDRDEKRRLSA